MKPAGEMTPDKQMSPDEKPIIMKGSKKKVILNKDGDEVVVEPTKGVRESRVLTYQERRKRAISIRRRLPKIKKGRQLALNRFANKKNLKKRTRNLARNYMRRRYAGKLGSNYQKLGPSDKIVVDRIISKKQGAINRVADRLLPRVKQAEGARLAAGRRSSKYNYRPITNSIMRVKTDKINDLAEKAYDVCVIEANNVFYSPRLASNHRICPECKNEPKTKDDCNYCKGTGNVHWTKADKGGITESKSVGKLMRAFKRLKDQKKPWPRIPTPAERSQANTKNT